MLQTDYDHRWFDAVDSWTTPLLPDFMISTTCIHILPCLLGWSVTTLLLPLLALASCTLPPQPLLLLFSLPRIAFSQIFVGEGTPVLLPGKSHGWRSLVGCSPWGRWELDTTEHLHFHFSLSCIGEGNGNPLQCSCLENPRDGGAWWAASMGSHKVRHDWSDLAAADICKAHSCPFLQVVSQITVSEAFSHLLIKNGNTSLCGSS